MAMLVHMSPVRLTKVSCCSLRETPPFSSTYFSSIMLIQPETRDVPYQTFPHSAGNIKATNLEHNKNIDPRGVDSLVQVGL